MTLSAKRGRPIYLEASRDRLRAEGTAGDSYLVRVSETRPPLRMPC
jgi:hypothetical protein